MSASLKRLAALRALQRRGAQAEHAGQVRRHRALSEALAVPLATQNTTLPAHLLQAFDHAREQLSRALPAAGQQVAASHAALLRANLELKQVETLVARAEAVAEDRRRRAEAVALENWLRHRPPKTGAGR